MLAILFTTLASSALAQQPIHYAAPQQQELLTEILLLCYRNPGASLCSDFGFAAPAPTPAPSTTTSSTGLPQDTFMYLCLLDPRACQQLGGGLNGGLSGGLGGGMNLGGMDLRTLMLLSQLNGGSELDLTSLLGSQLNGGLSGGLNGGLGGGMDLQTMMLLSQLNGGGSQLNLASMFGNGNSQSSLASLFGIDNTQTSNPLAGLLGSGSDNNMLMLALLQQQMQSSPYGYQQQMQSSPYGYQTQYRPQYRPSTVHRPSTIHRPVVHTHTPSQAQQPVTP